MSYNPYGGSGSIVMPPANVVVTSRRIGSAGWRLHNTANGRAVARTPKRTRNSRVTTNMPKGERILPTLDEATQERLARALTSTKTSATINLNVHDK